MSTEVFNGSPQNVLYKYITLTFTRGKMVSISKIPSGWRWWHRWRWSCHTSSAVSPRPRRPRFPPRRPHPPRSRRFVGRRPRWIRPSFLSKWKKLGVRLTYKSLFVCVFASFSPGTGSFRPSVGRWRLRHKQINMFDRVNRTIGGILSLHNAVLDQYVGPSVPQSVGHAVFVENIFV